MVWGVEDVGDVRAAAVDFLGSSLRMRWYESCPTVYAVTRHTLYSVALSSGSSKHTSSYHH